MWGKDWLLRRYYEWRRYVPGQWLYHRDHFTVAELLGADRNTAEAAIDLQLRHILRTAVRHVPFYRQHVRLSEAELACEPARELLTAFPYVTKSRVMECQRDFLDERRNPRALLYATSSGTSGLGIGVWRTKRLADIEKAFFAAEWGRFGFIFDKSRYLRIGGDSARRPQEPPVSACGNRLMLSPYHIAPAHKGLIIEALNRFQPEYIHAWPSCATALAELVRPGELDFTLSAILLASEPAEPHQLAALERTFGCPVSISYGLTERTNLAFSTFAAGTRNAYRFERLYGLTENVPSNGRLEIVGTSLWNDVMPLIRYRTGDYGPVGDDGVCDTIEGRAQEMLVDRWGRRIPGLSIRIDARNWDFVGNYQVRQSRVGAITIVVVPRHGPLTGEQKQRLLAGQVERWGGLFDIAVEEANELTLAANGKRQFVVSDLFAQRV